ncbi:hypothetical protein HN588_13360 [Candidatus Bathyarchaeota archaeon]|nr:hypothetical protein [Candidatus Bathyarchaeota archaeon]
MALTLAIAGVARTWLVSSITRAVEYRYDVRLEALRADIDTRQKREADALRGRQSDWEALRSSAITSRMATQTALLERRVQAVDLLCAYSGDVVHPVRRKPSTRSGPFRPLVGA